MKNYTLVLIGICISNLSLFLQRQLDIQGKSPSFYTVVTIKTNYSGTERVIGLDVTAKSGNTTVAHGGRMNNIGMIAEEVGKILPEIVVYEENGHDAIGMDYSKLTPLLIEAVKAQKKIIEGLQQENRLIKDELFQLHLKVNSMAIQLKNEMK